MRQGETPQSCTTTGEMAKRNVGKKSQHFQFLIRQHPGCKRGGEGSETALLLLLCHPSSRLVPFCSQELYFGRQIKPAACCSEFSTCFREVAEFGSQTGAGQPSPCCKASLKQKHLTKGTHLSPGPGQAKASGSTSAVEPAGVQPPWRPRVLTRASPAASSWQLLGQALTTPPSLSNLYPYPSIL